MNRTFTKGKILTIFINHPLFSKDIQEHSDKYRRVYVRIMVTYKQTQA